MIISIRSTLILVIVLLVGIWYVGHVLQIGELAVGSASVTKRSALGLNLSLGIDVLVPALHGIFVGVSNNEVVDNTRITLPEDLNAIETYSRSQKHPLQV